MPREYGPTNAAPWATAPAVGPAGDTYFNTATKQLNLSDGTLWLPQAGAPSAYYHGKISGPTGALGNDVITVISWSTTLSANMTLVSNQRITPGVVGKYKVTATVGFASGANAAAWTRGVITQYNSVGTSLGSRSVVGANFAANSFAQAVVDGVFDMAAGDYLTISGSVASSTGTFDSGATFVSVTPVGGAKGDPGALPVGGTVNQALVKKSATDYDVQWKDIKGNTYAGYNSSGAVSIPSTGTRDVLVVALGTAQSDVNVVISGVLYFGFANGWVNGTTDIVLNKDGSIVAGSPGVVQAAVANAWSTMPFAYAFPVTSGQDAGFKIRYNCQQVQSGAGWYDCRAAVTVFGRQ